MALLTRDDIRSVLRFPEDATVVAILATSASREEFIEAFEWLQNDEAFMNEGRLLPSGRIARVLEILDDEENQRLGEPE